jgi:hypothetical protein
MFRTVAAVFLFFGAAWLWRFGFTDYRPEQRPFGLAGGVLSLVLAVYLFRLRRFAIGSSAVAIGIVGLCAAVFAPNAKGPVILFLAGLALLCGAYAVMAARELLTREAR